MSHRITFQNHMDLRCGIVSRIRVGKLPPQIAHRIGAIYQQDIWLSTESYHHINTDHPDLSYAEIDLIPDAIEFGRIILDQRRDQWLTADYPHPKRSDEIYLLALKCNFAGDAIYARSLHRLRKRQVDKLARRGYVLRPCLKLERAPLRAPA